VDSEGICGIGEDVLVMVELESLALATGAAVNRFMATLEEVLFVGGTTLLIARLGDGSLIKAKVLTSQMGPYRPGETVELGFEKAAARVFPVPVS